MFCKLSSAGPVLFGIMYGVCVCVCVCVQSWINSYVWQLHVPSHCEFAVFVLPCPDGLFWSCKVHLFLGMSLSMHLSCSCTVHVCTCRLVIGRVAIVGSFTLSHCSTLTGATIPVRQRTKRNSSVPKVFTSDVNQKSAMVRLFLLPNTQYMYMSDFFGIQTFSTKGIPGTISV